MRIKWHNFLWPGRASCNKGLIYTDYEEMDIIMQKAINNSCGIFTHLINSPDVLRPRAARAVQLPDVRRADDDYRSAGHRRERHLHHHSVQVSGRLDMTLVF